MDGSFAPLLAIGGGFLIAALFALGSSERFLGLPPLASIRTLTVASCGIALFANPRAIHQFLLLFDGRAVPLLGSEETIRVITTGAQAGFLVPAVLGMAIVSLELPIRVFMGGQGVLRKPFWDSIRILAFFVLASAGSAVIGDLFSELLQS